MLALQLLTYSDDYGYFNANPSLIEAEVSPLRKPSVDIPDSLQRLSEIRYVVLGTGADGRRYGHIVNFETHQRVSHPSASKIKALSITWDELPNGSRTPPETVAKPSALNREQGKEQGTGKGVPASPPPPPRPRSKRKPKTALPENFGVSDRVKAWAEKKGFDRLDQHLESFLRKVRSHDYRYVDWDEAFMNAISDNWAHLPAWPLKTPAKEVTCAHAEPGQPACGLPNARPSDRYGGKPVCAHHERKLIEATSSRRIPGHIRDALVGITKRPGVPS